MPVKEHLSARLDPELLERLAGMAGLRRLEIADLISLALDALERVETLDEEVALVHEKLELLGRKMDTASTNEMERLRNLFQLIEKRLQTHDEAVQARFDRLGSPGNS